MYLLSRGYKVFKNGIVGIGGIGGVVGIGYGIATGGLGAIIWGSLLTTQSVIIGIDNYRSLQDLDMYLKNQTKEWKRQNTEMSKIFLQYQQEHNQFRIAMRESAIQMDTVKKSMTDEIVTFKKENDSLKEMIAKNGAQIDRLEALKTQYETQSQELQGQLQNLTVQNDNLHKTNETLQNEVAKLHELHLQSKQLLKNLVLAGDMFTQFEQSFGSAANRLDTTNTALDGKMQDLQATLQLLHDVAENLHKEHVRSLEFLALEDENVKANDETINFINQ